MASSIPASYDQATTLDQKQQLQSYLKENDAKGAPVYSFNPDASPQEKAAIAGESTAQLHSFVPQHQPPVATSTHLLCLTN